MFEHLDDPNPHSLGTDHQLAAVRSRGRAIVKHRRRNRLAAGSAVVAATAGVSAVAVVGLPGRNATGATAGSDSPSPVPLPASAVPSAAPVPVPTVVASSTASPVPAPVAASPTAASPTAAAATPEPASPTAAPVPAVTASPVPVAPSATPTTILATPAVSPTPLETATTATQDCAVVSGKLHTTKTPEGFTPLVPASGILSWSHVGAPLKSIVVDVRCIPFDPSQAPPGETVKAVTVLGATSWLIGDPSTGTLELTWNATPQTAVTVVAGITLPEKTGQVEDQLLALGNLLID